jgi:DNA-binding transcriptional LysR family regulator
MEGALGARLFERTQSGYEMTAAGREILHAAQDIDDKA